MCWVQNLASTTQFLYPTPIPPFNIVSLHGSFIIIERGGTWGNWQLSCGVRQYWLCKSRFWLIVSTILQVIVAYLTMYRGIVSTWVKSLFNEGSTKIATNIKTMDKLWDNIMNNIQEIQERPEIFAPFLSIILFLWFIYSFSLLVYSFIYFIYLPVLINYLFLHLLIFFSWLFIYLYF